MNAPEQNQVSTAIALPALVALAFVVVAHYAIGIAGTFAGYGFRDVPKAMPSAYCSGLLAGGLLALVLLAVRRLALERIAALRVHPVLAVVLAYLALVPAIQYASPRIGQEGEVNWLIFLSWQHIPAGIALALAKRRGFEAWVGAVLPTSIFFSWLTLQDWTDKVANAPQPQPNLLYVLAVGLILNFSWLALGIRLRSLPVRLVSAAIAYGLLFLAIGQPGWA